MIILWAEISHITVVRHDPWNVLVMMCYVEQSRGLGGPRREMLMKSP